MNILIALNYSFRVLVAPAWFLKSDERPIFLQYFYPSEIMKSQSAASLFLLFFIISTLINYYSRSRYQFIKKVQHLTKFCFDAEGGSWIVIYIPELYCNRRLFQTPIWKKVIKTKKMKGIAQMLYNQSGIINWNTHVCLLAPHSIAVKNLIGSKFVSTHYGFLWVNLQKDLQKPNLETQQYSIAYE